MDDGFAPDKRGDQRVDADEKKLIDKALQLFGIDAAECTILRHNENISCKVCAPDKTYSLRIHCPVDDFNTTLVNFEYDAYEQFQDEAELLCYMREHGFPELQEPIAGPDGRLIYRLSDGSPAMLLSWIPGRPIEEAEGKKYARELRKLAAKIHLSSKGFFGRRCSYDELLVDRLAEEVCSAVDCGHISPSAGDTCTKELRAIRTAISRLKEDGRHYGILHSDLGFGNVLVSDNQLIPIDFSLSGFGCYAQEAGMLQSNYQDEESRRLVLQGLAESGEEIDEKDAELFISLSVLLFICSQHGRYFSEGWFSEAMERWCSTLFIHG